MEERAWQVSRDIDLQTPSLEGDDSARANLGSDVRETGNHTQEWPRQREAAHLRKKRWKVNSTHASARKTHSRSSPSA